MPPSYAPVAAYAASVENLAQWLEEALREPANRDGVVAGYVDQATDVKAALAAVRVLGPDVFAPALLAGASPGPLDRAAVAEALRVFPVGPGEPAEVIALAAAQAALIAHPNHLDAEIRHHRLEGVLLTDGGWVSFTQDLARMSSLALPGCETLVAQLAWQRRLDVDRGVVRAMLRRDYPTAAGLARWSALMNRRGTAEGLRLEPVMGHLVQCGSSSARMALDVAVLQRLSSTPQEGR